MHSQMTRWGDILTKIDGDKKKKERKGRNPTNEGCFIHISSFFFFFRNRTSNLLLAATRATQKNPFRADLRPRAARARTQVDATSGIIIMNVAQHWGTTTGRNSDFLLNGLGSLLAPRAGKKILLIATSDGCSPSLFDVQTISGNFLAIAP